MKKFGNMKVLPASFCILHFAFLLFIALPAVVCGQNYVSQGGEYPIAGSLSGDQTFPQLAIKASGGYIVWQDNATDGDGLGISARKLDGSLSGSIPPFRVNQIGAADQEKPQVSMLNDGGAAFVWQGGKQGFQRIYSRFISSSNTWTTGDILVNTFTNSSQLNPVVATLTNGNVVVAWASFNQASGTSLQDVYAQRLSPSGAKLGGEFRVNTTTSFNQRTPSIAALADGRFVVVWISEQQRFDNSVDVFGKFFDANGNAIGAEYLVNTGSNVCANPSVAAASDGGFLVAWSEKDLSSPVSNSWDVVARAFSSAGVGGTARRVNTTTYGDQIGQKVAANGTDYLAVWTSLAQDGSREGVFGQYLTGNGSLSGGEFLDNTTTAGPQIHPTVASDGNGRFLTAWTSFGGGVNSFDLQAQRYATILQPLNPPDPPFVSALDQRRLLVTWPVLQGFSVSNYEVYADGVVNPTATVTNNMWVMANLSPASTHTFKLAYVLTDGRRSPLSGSSSGTTWGYDDNFDGLPDDWQELYWGFDSADWPSPLADSDGDGASNLDEFKAGTNPTDATSVLVQRIRRTVQGVFLEWNTQPGYFYQPQTTATPHISTSWTNLGSPRYAPGTFDSMNIGHGNPRGFYRVNRLR